MFIQVTTDDIKNGTRNDGRSCMVQRATKRRLPDTDVYASYGGNDGERPFIRINGEDINLHPRVGKFMKDFDGGKEVKPFKFFLRTPENLLK